MRAFPLSFIAVAALGSLLAGCPEKAGAPADKTSAEPEHAEPDDGAGEDKKTPAAAAPAAEEKKPDENKDEGGW